MKAIIQEVTFSKEYDSKFGKMYSFKVKYDDKIGIYSSKYKDQRTFIPTQEAEFTEETKTYKDKNDVEHEYTVVKPVNNNKQSNFGKALKKEQSRYSGFAVSYAKDMLIADKIKGNDFKEMAWKLFNMMVEMDKTLEQ